MSKQPAAPEIDGGRCRFERLMPAHARTHPHPHTPAHTEVCHVPAQRQQRRPFRCQTSEITSRSPPAGLWAVSPAPVCAYACVRTRVCESRHAHTHKHTHTNTHTQAPELRVRLYAAMRHMSQKRCQHHAAPLCVTCRPQERCHHHALHVCPLTSLVTSPRRTSSPASKEAPEKDAASALSSSAGAAAHSSPVCRCIHV